MSDQSVLEVLRRTVSQATGLTTSLVQLATAEVGESVGNVAKGVGALVAGLFVTLIGLLFLLHAAVAFLVLQGWSEAASYGMVGGGIIVGGIVVLIVGAMFLRGASPVPHRAIGELRALLGQEGRTP